MTRITVALGSRSYPVVVESGILARAAGLIRDLLPFSSVAILSHPRIAALYSGALLSEFDAAGINASLITVRPGERSKSLATIGLVYKRLLSARLDRQSLLLTLGGGVAGDIGGFAAATYMRGISCIQIPTTLLAQVDASIGGKTGIDLPGAKNIIGAFHQPRAVLIDPATLTTLPDREFRSGLAEVVKYGIIRDESLFTRLGDEMPRLLRRSSNFLEHIIERSCEIKAEVVGEDETEQGNRAILNFGHTIGHALESITAYRRYKHGEAISIGMVSAALIGEETGTTAPEVTGRICGLLRAGRLPVVFPPDINLDDVLNAMRSDKKAVGGVPRFVLAERIGRVIVSGDVPESAIRSALARQRVLPMGAK